MIICLAYRCKNLVRIFVLATWRKKSPWGTNPQHVFGRGVDFCLCYFAKKKPLGHKSVPRFKTYKLDGGSKKEIL